jgi:hypothetical protein
MNIDWKVVSQSDGYKSLKAAYAKDVQEAHKDTQRGRRPIRHKPEFRELFNFVISRAIHYAYHQNRTVSDVLNEWETKRGWSWWLNYYGEHRQPWLIKSAHVRWKSDATRRKEDIHRIRNAPDRVKRIESINKHYFNILLREQRQKSKRQGDKARWDNRKREYKAYLKKKSIR